MVPTCSFSLRLRIWMHQNSSTFGCNWLVSLMRLLMRWAQPLLQGAKWSCSRQQAQAGTQEAPKFLENDFHPGDGFTIWFHRMGTGVQEACGICILENAQSSPGLGPEQPALAGHVLDRVFPNGLQGPLLVYFVLEFWAVCARCFAWMYYALHVKEVSGFGKDSSLWKGRQHKLIISLYRMTFFGHF